MLHCELTKNCVRAPGVPESECRGELVDVTPYGKVVRRARPIRDAAQNGEGDVGQSVSVRLRRCLYCKETLVTAKCPNGTERLRNQWSKAQRQKPEAVAATA